MSSHVFLTMPLGLWQVTHSTDLLNKNHQLSTLRAGGKKSADRD